MEHAIHEMESQDVQAYILDLRNNPVLFFTYFANGKSCKVPFLTSNFCSIMFFFLLLIHFQGGLVKAGLDVAQIWLDGDETLVNTIDRDGNMSPISMIDGHAITHDPLVVLVSI